MYIRQSIKTGSDPLTPVRQSEQTRTRESNVEPSQRVAARTFLDLLCPLCTTARLDASLSLEIPGEKRTNGAGEDDHAQPEPERYLQEISANHRRTNGRGDLAGGSPKLAGIHPAKLNAAGGPPDGPTLFSRMKRRHRNVAA